MKIRLPFYPEFRERMLSGQKTGTSRTRKFGDVGDTFDAFGEVFEIVSVNLMQLGDVKQYHFKHEGFSSPEGFVAIWKRIHPIAGFRPFQKVWYHEFRLVPANNHVQPTRRSADVGH